MVPPGKRIVKDDLFGEPPAEGLNPHYSYHFACCLLPDACCLMPDACCLLPVALLQMLHHRIFFHLSSPLEKVILSKNIAAESPVAPERTAKQIKVEARALPGTGGVVIECNFFVFLRLKNSYSINDMKRGLTTALTVVCLLAAFASRAQSVGAGGTNDTITELCLHRANSPLLSFALDENLSVAFVGDSVFVAHGADQAHFHAGEISTLTKGWNATGGSRCG